MADINHSAVGLVPLPDTDPAGARLRFGGDPNLPDSIAWPMDAAGRPMHHLMQIDCAALPPVDPDFPSTGTLFVFITGSSDEDDAPALGKDAGASALIWFDGPVAGLPPRPHPPEAPPLGEYSYALEPVEIAVEPKPKGFLHRVFDTQPKAYSKSSTGAFAAVALDAVAFDSHPEADPVDVYTALRAEVTEDAVSDGIRPHQMLGHAPLADDLNQLDLHGYMEGTVAKATTAYRMSRLREEQAGDKAPVLLFQMATCPVRNFDLVNHKYALKVLIERGDLRARAFDRHWVINETLYGDGVWRHPAPATTYPTPPEEDIVASVILKPLVPGESGASPTNYFCGLPQLPDDMAWPTDAEGVALHFLAQLDLATIPERAGDGERMRDLPSLPHTGTLFVFANMFMDEAEGQVMVLHAPGSVSGLPVRQPPEDLVRLGPGEDFGPAMGLRDWRVPQQLSDAGDDVPAYAWEPRLPFDPVPLLATRFPEEVEDYHAARGAQVDAFRKALPHDPGAVPDRTNFVLDWLPNWFKSYGEMRADDHSMLRFGVVRRVPDSFPWRWADIQESAIAFFSAYRFEYPDKREDEEDVEARRALWPDEISPAVRDWYARAIAHDPLTRIDAATREAYRAWLLDLDAVAARIQPETADESDADHWARRTLEHVFFNTLKPLAMPPMNMSRRWLLHDPDADDFPEEMRAAQAEMLRFERSYSTFPPYNVVHEPSPHMLCAPASDRDYARQDVLLFEFSSGYGLSTQWADCSWLQIWIAPDDLAAGLFDKIMPTIRW